MGYGFVTTVHDRDTERLRGENAPGDEGTRPTLIPPPRSPGHADRGAVVRRRLVTIPRETAILVATTLLLPVFVPLALAVDVVRFAFRRRPFVTIRLVLFGWVFLLADVTGVVWLALQWLVCLGGRRRRRLVEKAWRVQWLWACTLLAAVQRLFSLRFEVDGAESARTGPVIVMFRHASIIDNLLPTTLLGGPGGIRLRWVIKEELLSVPGLDVAGGRLPNAFIDRNDPDPENGLRLIRALGEGLGDGDGVLIYPEGTRFTADRRRRAIDKLEAGRPDLAKRAARMPNVMPPRLGGATTLLDTGADVVIGAHAGLDGFARPSDVWSGSLVGGTIRVKLWRIPSDEIPRLQPDRVAWLYDVWEEVDRWVGAAAAGSFTPRRG